MSNVASPAVSKRASLTSPVFEAYERGRQRQPLLWGMAAVMALLMAPTLVAYGLDSRTVNGIDVWTKPLKFEFSLVFFFGTLAWFWGYLPAERTRGRILNAYALASAALIFLEVAYMIIQSARGVASHFNQSTPLEAVLFALMGIAAVIFTLFPVALGVTLARSGHLDLAPAFRLSVILGLILTFVLGGVAALFIVGNGGHWVSAPHTDAGGFPVFGWTRQGGDLRVAHFLGIHAMQILPLAGWFIARARPNATGLVWLAAAALSALTVYALIEALSGEPFLGSIG
jgi:hypothetical protein